uniref:Uncharacterized protein n=1 Tax=Anabas testudineus TaxID=64144 RepID=A0A7N6FKU1_ANATE
GQLRGTRSLEQEGHPEPEVPHRLCYVALDFAAESSKAASSSDVVQSYKLPDGQVIYIGSERFSCPEALFQPSLLGLLPADILGDAIQNSILKCDKSLRKDLYGNTVLGGGSSLFPGIEQRLQKELTALVPASMKVKVESTNVRFTVTAVKCLYFPTVHKLKASAGFK